MDETRRLPQTSRAGPLKSSFSKEMRRMNPEVQRSCLFRAERQRAQMLPSWEAGFVLSTARLLGNC